MKKLAEDICDGHPSSTDWNLKDVSYSVDYVNIKVEKQ